MDARDPTPETPPVVIVADDGPGLYSSCARASGYMEAIDVENGVYSAAFDALGRPLTIEVIFASDVRPRSWWGRLWMSPDGVEVALAPDAQPDPEALRMVLLDGFRRWGADQPPDATLADLIDIATQRWGITS